MTTPPKNLFERFPLEALVSANDEDKADFSATADDLAKAITRGVMWSLGVSTRSVVPGMHQLGGLLLEGRILPLRDGIRRDRAARMAIMISLNGADLLDVDVIELASGIEHATLRDLYIDQLPRAILALDYDGRDALNPSYWP